MLLIPVAFTSACLVCIWSRYCLRGCCVSNQTEEPSSSSSSTSCCCFRNFEDQPVNGGDDEIPLRSLRRNKTSYKSITDSFPVDETDNPVYYPASDSDLGLILDKESKVVEKVEKDSKVNGDVIDTKVPLLPTPNPHSTNISIPQPNLFLLPSFDALRNYSQYLKKSAIMAHGPEVVCASTLKSKSFDKKYNEEGEANVDNEMDAFDEKYEESRQKFLAASNLQIEEGRMRRNSSSEKRVLFDDTTNVRIYRNSLEDEEEK